MTNFTRDDLIALSVSALVVGVATLVAVFVYVIFTQLWPTLTTLQAIGFSGAALAGLGGLGVLVAVGGGSDK